MLKVGWAAKSLVGKKAIYSTIDPKNRMKRNPWIDISIKLILMSFVVIILVELFFSFSFSPQHFPIEQRLGWDILVIAFLAVMMFAVGKDNPFTAIEIFHDGVRLKRYFFTWEEVKSLKLDYVYYAGRLRQGVQNKKTKDGSNFILGSPLNHTYYYYSLDYVFTFDVHNKNYKFTLQTDDCGKPYSDFFESVPFEKRFEQGLQFTAILGAAFKEAKSLHEQFVSVANSVPVSRPVSYYLG